jgi:membrane associated rhomboid family serine protease
MSPPYIERRPDPDSGGLAWFTGRAVSAAISVALLLIAVWSLEIVDWALPGRPLDQFAIQPRDVGSLPYIFTAPFLHYGFGHLIGNSLPLVLLGFLAALRGTGRFVTLNIVIILVSGLGVWLVAAPFTATEGASGLVFGYFGYLVGRGIFERRTLDIVIAVVVVTVYGTMMLGSLMIPEQGVSWQGHLFGLIGGVTAAWVMRQPPAAPPSPPPSEYRRPVSGW